MPPQLEIVRGPEYPNRVELANRIVEVLFKYEVVLTYITWKYQSIQFHDAEDISSNTLVIFHRKIVLGGVNALTGIDRFDQIKEEISKGYTGFALGIADHLSLTHMKKNRRYVHHSSELLKAVPSKVEYELPQFNQIVRRGFEIAKDLLSPSQLTLIRLRRRGFTYRRIAEHIPGNHNRDWVSLEIKRSYRKIATLFVAHLDPDFLSKLRSSICRATKNRCRTKRRFETDESFVAYFIERTINNVAKKNTA